MPATIRMRSIPNKVVETDHPGHLADLVHGQDHADNEYHNPSKYTEALVQIYPNRISIGVSDSQ